MKARFSGPIRFTAAMPSGEVDAIRRAGVLQWRMAEHTPMIEDEAEAELGALARAVAIAEADPARIPHEEVRRWLLRLAAGEFDAPPPQPR